MEGFRELLQYIFFPIDGLLGRKTTEDADHKDYRYKWEIRGSQNYGRP
jgi:hypothetical protein